MEKGANILLSLMQLNIGGAETHVVELAKELKRKGFNVIVTSNGGVYVVEDRGGAIRGNRIDIFFSSHSKALDWGVRYCDVYVKR